jgi:hypothetical protein
LTGVARYDSIPTPTSNPDDIRLWPNPAPNSEAARTGRFTLGDRPRLQRRADQRNRKIKREDLINVLNRTDGSRPDMLEDEFIPGKAIVLKMPERSMRTYFIPLPIDLDVQLLFLFELTQGLKRRAIELFNLAEEVDVYNRLEFELFAFGIIPTSSSLPLLKDREVVYVNLLPPRPPTPFSLTLAPSRAENSLVAEVRRPGTGLPFEVVYTQTQLLPTQHLPDDQESEVAGPSVQKPKGSRFKEHMSERGSRNSRSLSVGEMDRQGRGRRSPGKIWYKEVEGTQEGEGLLNQDIEL